MNKKFIFFKEIDRGYSIRNSEIKGHIQIKNINDKLILSIFIENLKMNDYIIYIINNQNSVIKAVNFTSKIKFTEEISLNNSIDELQGVIIVPIDNITAIPLCAWYNNVDFNRDQVNIIIKNYYYRENKIKNKSKVDNEDKEKSTSIEEDNIEIPIEEKKEDENSPIIEDEIINQEDLNNKPRENSDKDLKGGVYNNQIHYLWKNIEKLDSLIERVEPFNEKIPHHKWWTVKEGNIEIQHYCILYNGYLMPMIYPFMNYKNILKDENNWIFGVVVNENYNENNVYKYFVYGIPGRFYMQEQPFKGSTGYLYWQSRDMKRHEDIGYWLLYVDVHTGKIVIPRRPVKPPLNKNIMHNDNQ